MLLIIHSLATMFLVLLLQLVLLHGAVGEQVEISLDSDSWSLSDTDGRVKAIKAQVPGVVHLDLMYDMYLYVHVHAPESRHCQCKIPVVNDILILF